MRPKWPHGSKIWKSKNIRIFILFVRPIEISTHTEISRRLYHSYIPSSNTLSYDLSNALLTMCIRHVEGAELAFKVAHKNAKSRKIQIQIQDEWLKSWKTYSYFGEKFFVFSIMIITASPTDPRKQIIHRLTHICSIRS